MKILLILNDAPYGSEKTYNALRFAMKLQHLLRLRRRSKACQLIPTPFLGLACSPRHPQHDS